MMFKCGGIRYMDGVPKQELPVTDWSRVQYRLDILRGRQPALHDGMSLRREPSAVARC